MTIPAAPSSPRRRPWRALLALLVLVGVTYFIYQRDFSTYHLAEVQPGVLYRDGAASIRQLGRAIDRVHPATVVCLVDDRELSDPKKPQFRQEIDYLGQRGIRIVRIPVPLGGYPTTADVRHFLDVVSDPSKQPVLVHCAQGVRRTAMMVAAYQESVLGYDKQKAKDSILSFGHSDLTINDIRRFIDGYDPVGRTVPAEIASVDRSEK